MNLGLVCLFVAATVATITEGKDNGLELVFKWKQIGYRDLPSACKWAISIGVVCLFNGRSGDRE